jgi:hypothetical protein
MAVKPSDLVVPDWAEYETILEGVGKMQPAIESFKAELLAAQKAKREGKPKRLAYHMRRLVNVVYNLDHYFWQPMFEWAQIEDMQRRLKRKRGKINAKVGA